MKVILPSAPMRKKPNEFSNLETECLFGEEVEILDNFSDWHYCKLKTDNYCGWVKKIALGHLQASN